MSNHRAPPPSWLNESYLEDALRKHFNQPDLKIESMEISAGSAEGDNYVCQIFRIKLAMDNIETKKLSIIAKVKPETKSAQVPPGAIDDYKVEADFFQKLLPAVERETRADKQMKKFAPECYHIDDDQSLILMEDMKETNYLMPTRGQFLNKEQAMLVMEALATMHGSSFRVVQKEPSLKKIFEKGMLGSEPNEIEDKIYDNGMNQVDKNMADYGMSEDWYRRLRAVGERLKKESFKVCDFQDEHLNVLRHGDPWMNNMMFHFSDGVPDDVILLDFQVVTYNSFAHDLHYFLFSSVNADVLVNDLDTLLETYFNKLKAVAPEIPNLTLGRIRQEFEETQFLGCIILITFRPFIYAPRPADLDEFFEGRAEMGYDDPRYVEDLNKLLPLMEKAGVF